MDNLLKRILLPILLTGWLASPAAIAAAVDIVIADNDPATINLARAVEHALQQLRPAPATTVVDVTAVNKNPARDALVIPLGDNLAEWAASPVNGYAATLCFYVSSGNYAANGLGSARSALFRDQPLARQLLLARALLPDARTALVMHNQPLVPIAWNNGNGRRFADFTLRVNRVDDGIDWAKPLSRWLTENDVLIGVEDKSLYNRATIRSVLLTTYRHGKVLIGPNRGFVNAGSLASAYTSPEQYLVQLQAMVQSWLDTRTLPTPQFPVQYQIAVNRQVASSLGLTLPDDQVLLTMMQAQQALVGEVPR